MKPAALAVVVAALAIAAPIAVVAQGETWYIPASTTRAVLAQWTERSGFDVVRSEGIPDFPTQERQVPGSFSDAVRALVSGYGSSRTNPYCPPSTRYPAVAYTLDARVDPQTRLIFVHGVPTQQECRLM